LSRSPNKPPEQVYAEAEAQIETARRRGNTSIRLGKGRRSFLRLPDLSGAQFVTELNLAGTGIHDLSPVAHLKNLRSLNINDTSIVSIRPLARLNQLQRLFYKNSGPCSIGWFDKPYVPLDRPPYT
jgi:hypothetical protein